MQEEQIVISTRTGWLVASLSEKGAVFTYMWGPRSTWIVLLSWVRSPFISTSGVARTEIVAALKQRSASPLQRCLLLVLDRADAKPPRLGDPLCQGVIDVLHTTPGVRTVARVPLNKRRVSFRGTDGLYHPAEIMHRSSGKLWADYGRIAAQEGGTDIFEATAEEYVLLSDLDPWFGDQIRICRRSDLRELWSFYFKSKPELEAHDRLIDLWNTPDPPAPPISQRLKECANR